MSRFLIDNARYTIETVVSCHILVPSEEVCLVEQCYYQVL
jgi:hypothetical protein